MNILTRGGFGNVFYRLPSPTHRVCKPPHSFVTNDLDARRESEVGSYLLSIDPDCKYFLPVMSVSSLVGNRGYSMATGATVPVIPLADYLAGCDKTRMVETLDYFHKHLRMALVIMRDYGLSHGRIGADSIMVDIERSIPLLCGFHCATSTNPDIRLGDRRKDVEVWDDQDGLLRLFDQK